jgi:hypothetical protein
MRRWIIMTLILTLSTVWAIAVYARHADSELSVTIFDSDPSHLWNRLYAALRVRDDQHGARIGEDSLDPPLWAESEHLLSQPSHHLALETLDEFLRTHGENLIHDPLKRALLQHDLWAVFDWTVSQFPASEHPNYDKEKQELQFRLAEVMRRLALTPDEIKALPDTYAQAVASGAFAKHYDSSNREHAFLPPDLFDPHGTWAGITPSPEYGQLGVARDHTFECSARSTFLVFVRLPGGHKATMDYFQTLWNFPQPYVPASGGPSDDQATVSPDLPSFPAGTAVALIRRMNLFDTQGNLVATPIVESVQIRVYHDITTTRARFSSRTPAETIKNSGQDFYELRLSRPLLFSGRNGGLRTLSRDEKEFSTFRSKGGDEIEELAQHPEWEKMRVPIVQTCIWCHSGGGVHSFNSIDALFRPNRKQVDPKDSDYGSVYWGDDSAIDWKQNRYDWGLLNGYWKASSAAQH